ncbi:hypothetical protein Barb7_00555 [Bacteroidales bacterium Barb7]|nr:hypothetical protein Barb7_00555 [Bacteroidales bacterium Barb7]
MQHGFVHQKEDEDVGVKYGGSSDSIVFRKVRAKEKCFFVIGK